MTMTRGILVGAATNNPPPDYVRRMAAIGFDVTVDDLRGPSRERPLVGYRQITMAAIRRLCRLSYPAIGREFGDRDHTTAMHAVRKVEQGRHHPPGTPQRRLFEAMITLIDSVRAQWSIDTGQSLSPEAHEAPFVEFS